ncbi:MAG: hypothetical protein KGJ89_05465 [Patescibacteria group bacterium]|nr:hypothetical protein [Patescibacteria group bacterium]MDE2227370.1 hypothetical protein [Patescibacteria group bacterium]
MTKKKIVKNPDRRALVKAFMSVRGRDEKMDKVKDRILQRAVEMDAKAVGASNYRELAELEIELIYRDNMRF